MALFCRAGRRTVMHGREDFGGYLFFGNGQ